MARQTANRAELHVVQLMLIIGWSCMHAFTTMSSVILVTVQQPGSTIRQTDKINSATYHHVSNNVTESDAHSDSAGMKRLKHHSRTIPDHTSVLCDVPSVIACIFSMCGTIATHVTN